MSTLKAGQRLKSQVDATEVVVVRAPADDVLLTAGGHPMLDLAEESASGLSADAALSAGALLGKRYVSATEPGLEVLVTKAGAASLGLADAPLAVKDAKPLPASD